MNNKNPLVSVVVPVFNAELYIAKTLDSIFGQTFDDYEVIVIDDGSTDRTPEIIKKYETYIRSYRISNSGSPSRPRNYGISLSFAKYISLFDHDDLMLPQKLEKQIALLEKFKSVSFVFSDFNFWDGKETMGTMFGRKSTRDIVNSIPRKIVGNNVIFERPIYQELLMGNFIGTATVVVRREAILSVGGFDESLVGIDDLDMWLKLSEKGYLGAYVEEVLSNYRVFEGRLTCSPKTYYSHINFWENLLKKERIHSNRQAVKYFHSQASFSLGYLMVKKKKYVKGVISYVKALGSGSWMCKVRIVMALCKIPFHMVRSCLEGWK